MKKTKIKSAEDLDGNSWRLIKMISKTNLGRQLERDGARVAEIRNRLRVQLEWWALTMAMIPKPGKDHTKVKG